ncbi:MAG: hypothetical protein OEV64_05015 [Desulfobulbaceae bacterium]|nr:hypothetical protein [Desulfobulbaceae bacterium]
MERLKNCWEIKKCGRHADGDKIEELGECVVSREQLGHSCWAVFGTLCGGEVQGDAYEKGRNCMRCEVYKMYQRTIGEHGEMIKIYFPEEEEKYNQIIFKRMIDRKK